MVLFKGLVHVIMTQPVKIRMAEINDLSQISVLFDDYRQFYECPPNRSACQDWIEKNLRTDRSKIFVPDSTKGLVGFAQLYPALCSVDLVKYFIVYDLFVATSVRRTGIGRALMIVAEDWAKKQGAARLDLETARNNTVAQELYKSLQYEPDEIFVKYSLDLS